MFRRGSRAALAVHARARRGPRDHGRVSGAPRTRRTRRVDVVRPARSEDARGKEDRPSHRVSDRLPLSPLDSALCIRGLVVYWAFGFDRRLDPDAVRASLAATLVKYPALAGRARVRARRGATLSPKWTSTTQRRRRVRGSRQTRDDARRPARRRPPSAQNNVTPSSLFRPLHIRCCENEGAIVRRAAHQARRRRRAGDRPRRLLVARPGGRTRDARVLRGVDLRGARAPPRRRAPRSPGRAPRPEPRPPRGAGGRGAARRARVPELRLEEPPSAFALARGACGVLGDAFRRLAQVTAHIPAADARALKASWTRRPRTTPSAATWTLFRRLREADRAARRFKGSTEARQTARALFPVDHRPRRRPRLAFEPVRERLAHGVRAARGGNAGRGPRRADRDPGRAEEAPEKAAARRMAAATRVAVSAAKSPAGLARARGEIFAPRASPPRQIAAAVAAVADVSVSSAWQFPEIWDCDFDGAGAGAGAAYFFGSVPPAAAWTAAAWPAGGAGWTSA